MTDFPYRIIKNGALSVIAVGLGLALPGLAFGAHHEKNEEEASIDSRTPEQVCGQMIEAWYGGDAEKMDGALHEGLAKRGVLKNSETGKTVLTDHGKADLVEGARSGAGKLPADEWDITTETIHTMENIAIVKVTSAKLIDICQVARLDSGWTVVNVIWTDRK